MGFLKKLGQIAAAGLKIATGIAPFAAPVIQMIDPKDAGVVTQVANDLSSISGIVQAIEVAAAAATAAGTPLAGPQKLVMAAPLVEQIILSSDLLAKHKISDPVKFKAGVEKITGGVADILSSLEDKVDTTDKKA
jgi:hypothetical protein